LKGRTFLRLTPLLVAALAVFAAFFYLARHSKQHPGIATSNGPTIRVLSYSGFVASWGPGPELAKRFENRTGIKVDFRDAGDAGLLMKKLELFPSDVVIGLDEIRLDDARTASRWHEIPKNLVIDPRWTQPDFVAFDWAPMAFIYREGEVEPPTSLQDLLHERFRGAITLMDPRTSAPGLQFVSWVLDELGLEQAEVFLKALKPNVHSVSSGWTQAYGLFSKRQAKLALSYLTSPVFHWTQDKDLSYQAAVFKGGHPVHVEYAGIPATCEQCAASEQFLRFLVEVQTQKLIMQKNVMFPVVPGAIEGSEFQNLPQVELRASVKMNSRDSIFALWQQSEL
jgi:thiamine transport system substrate-binding protein